MEEMEGYLNLQLLAWNYYLADKKGLSGMNDQFYLSFHGSHFAMEPTLTQGLWMTSLRSQCSQWSRSRTDTRFFSLLAKKSSYPLNTGGVAGRADSIGSMLGSSTEKEKPLNIQIQRQQKKPSFLIFAIIDENDIYRNISDGKKVLIAFSW